MLKYGDWLLAKRGITVVAGAERGRSIPDETALTSLRPKTFLEPDERNIWSTQMQERALDESGLFFAPWGRDLLWRIQNNKDGEGETFLATLDKTKYYVFAGDRDLQDSDGNAVVLYLYCDEGPWGWYYDYLGHGGWRAYVQLLTLGNSSV